MRSARNAALVLALLGVGCAAGPMPASPLPGLGGPPEEIDLAAAMLEVHNRERAAVGAAPLVWDRGLAAGAEVNAAELGRTGRLAHSPRQTRAGTGENLWRGTAGAFSPQRMAGDWAGERRMFRPGIFPNVSTTGNWADVAHYTQMIWPSTMRLGCGLHRSGGWDYLVCRYAPAGNVDGARVP